MPRLPIYVTTGAAGDRVVRVRPLIDSGAEYSLFDGTVALELGWSEQDIAGRAFDVRPVTGVGRVSATLLAYRHDLTVLISLGRRYAVVRLTAFLTPPNALTLPVLGRRDFLSQVDFGLVEAEQRFLLRFRAPSALHDSW